MARICNPCSSKIIFIKLVFFEKSQIIFGTFSILYFQIVGTDCTRAKRTDEINLRYPLEDISAPSVYLYCHSDAGGISNITHIM